LEGVIKGSILKQPQGDNGFGYDPIFCPNGYTQSFAEISLDEKSKISHRGIATQKLVAFLKNQT
jgi:XTP/dITP diphosphohydrolase